VFGTVESYLFVGPPPGPKANPSVTPNITLTDATVRFLAKPKPPASAPATEKSKAPATQPAPANPTP